MVLELSDEDLALLNPHFDFSPEPLFPGLDPAMLNGDPQTLTDVVLVSADVVCFHARAETLLANSNNSFNGMLHSSLSAELDPSGDSVIWLTEPSLIVKIMLYTIFDSMDDLSPSLNEIVAAVVGLKKYGMNIRALLAAGTPLLKLLEKHAPQDALALFVLAAQHDLHELAAYASSHLLSLDICSLDDDVVDQINPVYLKHLFLLHMDRVTAFKLLLIDPPKHHPPTASCTDSEQMDRLNRTWGLVTCFLSFAAKPDLSEEAIKSTFDGAAPIVSCEVCRRAVADRLQKVADDWSAVKNTV